jgi:hypothetical protein
MQVKHPRKYPRERLEVLHREGWKLVSNEAYVLTNDAKDQVAVVFLDGRYFRGTLVDEP